MKRLPDEVWLHAAKRLSQGGQTRIIHRGCSSSTNRPNLTMKHLPDRYVAYCQACKGAAVAMKEHVAYGYVAPAVSNLLTRPTDALTLDQLEPHERAGIAEFLATKNMDLIYLSDAVVGFSRSRKRLLITDPATGHMMGRDTSGLSPSKWLTYDGQHFTGPARWAQGSPALMVEDTFSMYKVRWALKAFPIPVAVYCSLGTTMHASLFRTLMERHVEVDSFYDGDRAGMLGESANAKELAAVGILRRLTDYADASAPLGMDPKDMTILQIHAHVRSLYSHLL